jgi:hypothetical protein
VGDYADMEIDRELDLDWLFDGWSTAGHRAPQPQCCNICGGVVHYNAKGQKLTDGQPHRCPMPSTRMTLDDLADYSPAS